MENVGKNILWPLGKRLQLFGIFYGHLVIFRYL
jgi:hypothetical protein